MLLFLRLCLEELTLQCVLLADHIAELCHPSLFPLCQLHLLTSFARTFDRAHVYLQSAQLGWTTATACCMGQMKGWRRSCRWSTVRAVVHVVTTPGVGPQHLCCMGFNGFCSRLWRGIPMSEQIGAIVHRWWRSTVLLDKQTCLICRQ